MTNIVTTQLIITVPCIIIADEHTLKDSLGRLADDDGIKGNRADIDDHFEWLCIDEDQDPYACQNG